MHATVLNVEIFSKYTPWVRCGIKYYDIYMIIILFSKICSLLREICAHDCIKTFGDPVQLNNVEQWREYIICASLARYAPVRQPIAIYFLLFQRKFALVIQC
jgi:hypothetical protein